MSMYSDITDRFDILDFEPAIEYIKRKEEERKELKRKHQEYKRKIEKIGKCDGCGEKENNRWVRNEEFYSCYGCFIHDLDCESSVMVPVHRFDEMKEYVDEGEWDELWEIENNKKNCDICKYSSLDYNNELYCEHWNGLVKDLEPIDKCYKKI